MQITAWNEVCSKICLGIKTINVVTMKLGSESWYLLMRHRSQALMHCRILRIGNRLTWCKVNSAHAYTSYLYERSSRRQQAYRWSTHSYHRRRISRPSPKRSLLFSCRLKDQAVVGQAKGRMRKKKKAKVKQKITSKSCLALLMLLIGVE